MITRSLALMLLATSPALADNWDLPLAWPADNYISVWCPVFCRSRS